MHILKNIVLCGCLFLFGCEGGSLNPGVGQSDKFVSLAERMNADVRLKQGFILKMENGTEYVDFQITGIESIDELQTNEALVMFPEYNLETHFNRTEIIRIQTTFIDDQGNMITRTVPILLGTKDKYYSESEFPLDKLLAVFKFPSFEVSYNDIGISYFHDNIVFSGIDWDSDFVKNGSVLSYAFERILFDVIYDYEYYFDTTHGSGRISAEKEGELPTF